MTKSDTGILLQIRDQLESLIKCHHSDRAVELFEQHFSQTAESLRIRQVDASLDSGMQGLIALAHVVFHPDVATQLLKECQRKYCGSETH